MERARVVTIRVELTWDDANTLPISLGRVEGRQYKAVTRRDAIIDAAHALTGRDKDVTFTLAQVQGIAENTFPGRWKPGMVRRILVHNMTAGRTGVKSGRTEPFAQDAAGELLLRCSDHDRYH